MKLARLEVLGSDAVGRGWLTVERQTLRNHYADGTVSEPFVADSAHRPGVDAVAVAAWRRRGQVEVLLRECLRPGVELRTRLGPPVPDAVDRRGLLWEIPAGIPEADEQSAAGLPRCGARELLEETGHRVDAATLVSLGAGTYPSGGILAEVLFLYAVEVAADAAPEPIAGDGTPFEVAGEVRWWPLAEAIAACRAGVIADAKTEIALRRLRDLLEETP